ncbi:MAG: DNA-3-methyladenine glycosylase 2 family protein, partial [Parasporobacterium sp.]|nr:DNA-3-methyladenine glycosylase 2 family protein [Parasporobacterium sp.]
MKVSDFNLKQTLECGQCFNFEKVSESESEDIKDCRYEYNVIACGKMLNIRQESDELIFRNASDEDVQKVWIPYFDLERDYRHIKDMIIKADPVLEPVIERYYGIRILNQDFEETLLSFIISQNKSIPQIKQLVRRIEDTYGPETGGGYHAFPDLEKLNEITEQDFRDMKTGFRAPYLRDAIDRMYKGSIKGEELRKMDFHAAKSELMKIKGVGDKVANCVLLFGLGFRNEFPVDVWIKR